MGLERRGATLGVEEEYLLVDAETRDLASRPPAEFMDRCKAALGDRVTHEFLHSQVEIGTGVCATVDDVARELADLRGTVASVAERYGMRLVAASTHPWANWHEQVPVDIERYRILHRDHRTIARRLVVCGMHIHAGIADQEERIDAMNQMVFYLPHLLALSTSSPFWEGDATGLKSFRPTIFGDLPRTGLPEPIHSWQEWRDILQVLDETLEIDDASKIWWDIRPSAKNPTLEMRVCDVCTRLEDALAIAAIYQCLLALFDRLRMDGQTSRSFRRILNAENKWRAQRFGVEARLGDFGRRSCVPMAEVVERLVAMLRDCATDLGCVTHLERALRIVERGTSADMQLAVFDAARAAGDDDRRAQEKVVDRLVDETMVGVSTFA